MKKVSIYYFSGTGNTRKCAEYLQQELLRVNIQTELFNIEQTEAGNAGEDMVLCYPTHGFNAPEYMIRFCKKIPKGQGKVWFLKTSGEPLKLNDNSSSQLVRVMKKKGYSIMGEFHYVMPYNMIFRHSDEMASLMWKTARERIPDAAKQIASETGSFPGKNLPAVLLSGICRIEHPFYPVNGHLFRVDMKKCIRCMRCVNNCPVNNISFSGGKFHFGNECTECTRCSFDCPKDAVHIGLLDFMRVNGPYDFEKDPKKAVIGNYCHDSYVKYFREES